MGECLDRARVGSRVTTHLARALAILLGLSVLAPAGLGEAQRRRRRPTPAQV